MKLLRNASLAGAALCVVSANAAFAQGSLTPPGPPAPTMKTLDQIESRVAISSAPFTINANGSYYLTSNLSVSSGDAITINATAVSLDLNGFSISSTAATPGGNAISIAADTAYVVVKNGTILSGVTQSNGSSSGTGFQNGIFFPAASHGSARVSDVTVIGCSNNAISLGSDFQTIVEHCAVFTPGGVGIAAGVVRGCVARGCGSNAIVADQVSDSFGDASSTTFQITAISARTVQNSEGTSATGVGISADTATNCRGSSSGNRAGISAATAQNCYGLSSGGPGISATMAQNCYGQSTGGTGLDVSSAAMNCFGESTSGTGLHSLALAIGCHGKSESGTGLSAFTANSCRGVNSGGVSESITNKYNMP